jgi:hypothetical protein
MKKILCLLGLSGLLGAASSVVAESYRGVHGGLVQNGRAVFPVVMWTEFRAIADKHRALDVLLPAKFDVLSYGVPRADGAEFRRFVERCETAGVGFYYGLYGGSNNPGQTPGDPLLDWVLQSEGAAIRSNPALAAYYYADDIGYWPVADLAARAAAVRGVDASHALFHSGSESQLADRGHLAELLGVQSYPINRWMPRHSQPHAKTCVAEAEEGGAVPLFIAQSFAWSDYGEPATSENRFPSSAEIDAMTWAGVSAGVKGVVFYSFGLGDFTTQALSVRYPDQWQRLKRLRNDLRALEAVLLFGRRELVREYGNDLFASGWRYGDSFYLLAVNARRDTATVSGTQTISVELPPGLGKAPQAVFTHHTRRLNVAEGRATGTLPALNVQWIRLNDPRPKVGNGGFGSLAAWSVEGGSSRVVLADGKAALRLRGSVGTAAAQSVLHTVEPGKRYRLSVTGERRSGDDRSYGFVQFRDFRGELISTFTAPIETLASGTRSVDFTAPAGFGKATVGLWRESARGGDIFARNISLTRL